MPGTGVTGLTETREPEGTPPPAAEQELTKGLLAAMALLGPDIGQVLPGQASSKYVKWNNEDK